MKLNGRLRTILIAFAVLALLAIGVVAMQGDTTPGTEAVAVNAGGETCSGDCSTCPHATAAEGGNAEAGAAPSVDQTRCVGCVRCVNVAPEAFRMNPETGRAEIIEGAPSESVERGAKACPVDAINT